MHNSKKSVAAIQLASGSNVSANLLETARLTEAAVKQGAQMIVLPENFAFIGRHCKDTNSLREAPNDGPLLINARAETLAEKPAFKGLFAKKRCIVLIDGFDLSIPAPPDARWRSTVRP